jgi:hypothetical protein
MTIIAQPGLDAGQRSMLERLVIQARVLLEHDLATEAEGRFGIHRDGTVEDDAALPADTTDKPTRRDLEQIVAHFKTLGEDAHSAVARLLREAAFTHLNRLIAIRIAEAIGLLPESLAAGPQSRGFKDLGEIMPILAGDYRAYIRLCGDELAADAPALFDPRNPLLALEPSTSAFDELVTSVSAAETTTIWSAADTLGWTYQFFNTADERREMREVAAPRNSHELAVRNQFFTPRYVVDFLVQNTIGRRLIENDPSTPLLEELPLLVDPPTTQGPPLDLADVKCLDPACGSGHFLLGCYDILERAWDLAGIPPSMSAPSIVASLWGVDIDLRCAQVASAALVFRARRHCRDLVLPRPNIVVAQGLPGGSAALPADLELTMSQRTLVDRVSEVLAKAPLLGTLLKAEEALNEEIRRGDFGDNAGSKGRRTLTVTDEVAEATERDLLRHMQAIADQASSSVVERLLAAEADDALRLVQVVRQRYDAVVMNPPFGEPVPDTKPYLKAAYKWLPSKGSNIFTAFVGRGLELCKTDGYLGAITSRAGMFLTTFERWRREVLLGNRLTVLADLGYGVMEQALVEAAAYVVGPGQPKPGHEAVFIRLLKDTNRVSGLAQAIATDRKGLPDNRIFRISPSAFDAAPGAPLAYWMSPSIRRLFTDLKPLEGHGADVLVGLQTSDDFRFVRAFWEVAPNRVARSRHETTQGVRWCPFAKGGEYSPYWADIHLLVDWEDDGRRIKEHVDRQYPYLNGKVEWVVKNTAAYFRSGLTWPRRTNSGFGVRILPAGSIFADKGCAILEHGVDSAACLGVLTSRLIQALIDSMVAAGEEVSSGGASRSYEVGLVQRLPSPLGLPHLAEIGELARSVSARVAHRDAFDETARRFVGPLPLSTQTVTDVALAKLAALEEDHLAVLESTLEMENLLHAAVNLDDRGLKYLDEEVGPHPANYKMSPPRDLQQFARLYTSPIDSVIDEVVKEKGGARAVANLTFFADRRLEVLAHAFECHPKELVEARRSKGLTPPGFLRSFANDLFSYLFGCAIGRWDVRIGLDPGSARLFPDLFEPVPLCPPGLLVGPDGFPDIEAPAEYPLDLPYQQILVDEPGAAWDVEAAVHGVAETLFADPAAIIDELLGLLGRKSVRDYLRRQFFKDHLSRYSKSRRKAPIYWPLTVPSKNWGVWVYAPALTRETLYAVGKEASRRERLATEAIVRLQREQHEGDTGRAARKVAEELDIEETLVEELRHFRIIVERIAGLGWTPDLDDGLVLCAAPLSDIFPSWPDARSAREELRRGKYTWSTVAGWADQL